MEKKEYLKENAEQIGERVLYFIKKNNLSNKQIAEILGYNENIISRKNKNKNGAYYDYDDLKNLARVFNCSIDKLCGNDLNNRNLFEENPIILKRDYVCIINYLNTIGLYFEPGYFWRGTNKQFLQAAEKIAPFLSPKAKKFYNDNKKLIDNGDFENELILLLTDNPIKDFYNKNFDDIKIKSKNNIGFVYYLNFDGRTAGDKIKAGYIEIRFILYNNSNNNTQNEYLKTISVNDIENIFAFTDKITKTSINALLNNSVNDYQNPNNNIF